MTLNSSFVCVFIKKIPMAIPALQFSCSLLGRQVKAQAHQQLSSLIAHKPCRLTKKKVKSFARYAPGLGMPFLCFSPHNIDTKFLHLRNEATKFDILDSCKLKQNTFLIAQTCDHKTSIKQQKPSSVTQTEPSSVRLVHCTILRMRLA